MNLGESDSPKFGGVRKNLRYAIGVTNNRLETRDYI